MRGFFIVFEGIEGSGKSTQAKLLYEYLVDQGIPCILTREPGGTEIGEQIRAILLNKKNLSMTPKTELFLYLASRTQHIEEKILPALKEGKVVISDRFSLSSFAYQGQGRALGLEKVSWLNKYATNNLRPDLTILVDIPLKLSQNRLAGVELDRLEKETENFHLKVREAYLHLAKKAPKKIKVFDGTQSVETLHLAIRAKVIEILYGRGII